MSILLQSSYEFVSMNGVLGRRWRKSGLTVEERRINSALHMKDLSYFTDWMESLLSVSLKRDWTGKEGEIKDWWSNAIMSPLESILRKPFS